MWGCIILHRKLGDSQRLATCRYLQGRGSWQRAWLDKSANSIITSDDEQSGDNCELTEPAYGNREGDVAIGGANVGDETSSSHEATRVWGKADKVDWIEGAGSGGYNMGNDIVDVLARET